MLEASKRILSFTHGMNYYEFKEDFKTQDAVLRNLEVLGEASNKIPEKARKDYPDLPWKKWQRREIDSFIIILGSTLILSGILSKWKYLLW